MPKKTGIVFITAGTVLFLSALSLFLHNRNIDTQAGRVAENLLADVQTMIQNQEKASSGNTEIMDTAPAPEETLSPELPVVEIEGYDYVGCISIPKLELELPVMSQWDYERLRIAPCRQFGSSRTDDLVIAAHNYKNHFGSISKLEAGDIVRFTDMDGIENCYKVVLIDVLDSAEVETVRNSNYDLVLYTCTYGGQMRVTVFCDRY